MVLCLYLTKFRIRHSAEIFRESGSLIQQNQDFQTSIVLICTFLFQLMKFQHI